VALDLVLVLLDVIIVQIVRRQRANLVRRLFQSRHLNKQLRIIVGLALKNERCRRGCHWQ